MADLQQYALRVIVGALICGVLLAMVSGGIYEKLLRMLSGVFLSVILLSSLLRIRWEFPADFLNDVSARAEEQAEDGAEMAQQETGRIISDHLEAYISDKSKALGAVLAVTVTLGENLMPVQVALHGDITPQSRQAISDMIEYDLGISKENQLWTG